VLSDVTPRLLPLPLRIAKTIFWVCIFLVLLSPIKTPFNHYDEGISVFYATRILNNDVPYKDFWSIYPPGHFYTLAILLKLFGSNLLVPRIYDTVVRLVIVISIYLITKKISQKESLAYLTSILTTLLLVSAGFYTYVVFPALALGLLSITCLIEYMLNFRRSGFT
jgi:hypothetical protein